PELFRQFFLGKHEIQVFFQSSEFGIRIYLYNCNKTFDYK
ncbi:hypothetical protein HMPREF3038_02806, partial [Akkermansia sp. KLE1797]